MQIRASGGISTNNADITAGSGRVFASNIVNSITAGKNVTIAGTPQNLIISSKAASGGGSNAGGVSSIGLSVPTFLSVAGSPITSDGTLAVTYSGTALPLANGGTCTTTGGVANGVEFYNGTTLTNSANFVFDGTNVGIGTTTPGSLLSIGGVANFTTATSTFYGQGVNLEDGCYAIGGVCIPATGLGGLSSVTADYPLTGLGTAGSHLSLAFGTTTSNTWGGTQTFTNTPTLATLSGLIAGNAGNLYQVASSSLFGFTPISNALAKGNFIVGNDAGTAQATSTLFISSIGRIGIGTTTPNNKLDIYSTTKSAIGFSGASGSTYKWTMGMDVSNGGRFSIASPPARGTPDRLVILGNGNVGIGNATPAVKLDVGTT